MNKYLRDALTLPGDIHRAWRTDGAHGAWQEIAERTVYRVARTGRYDLYDRELAGVRVLPSPAGVEVRMLAPSEHSLLHHMMTRRRRAQLDRGGPPRIVCAALRDGRVVGYSWWTYELDVLMSLEPLALPADGVFHGYVHVDRAERHRGLANALFSTGEDFLRARGARVCWFLSSTSNVVGARASRARWGGRSRHIARLSYWKLPFHTVRRLTLVEPE